MPWTREAQVRLLISSAGRVWKISEDEDFESALGHGENIEIITYYTSKAKAISDGNRDSEQPLSHSHCLLESLPTTTRPSTSGRDDHPTTSDTGYARSTDPSVTKDKPTSIGHKTVCSPIECAEGVADVTVTGILSEKDIANLQADVKGGMCMWYSDSMVDFYCYYIGSLYIIYIFIYILLDIILLYYILLFYFYCSTDDRNPASCGMHTTGQWLSVRAVQPL
jgi:hypothetical protein